MLFTIWMELVSSHESRTEMLETQLPTENDGNKERNLTQEEDNVSVLEEEKYISDANQSIGESKSIQRCVNDNPALVDNNLPTQNNQGKSPLCLFLKNSKFILFQIPMLLDDSSQNILDDPTDDLMHQDLLDPYPCLDELGDVDPMQWGPEAFPNLAPLPDEPDCQIKEEIKIEPVSPMTLLPPSPSPSSSSSSDTWIGESISEVKRCLAIRAALFVCNYQRADGSALWQQQEALKRISSKEEEERRADEFLASNWNKGFILETPPISPPQVSDSSPPDSPQPNNKNQDSVVMMSPIKIVPVSKNGDNATKMSPGSNAESYPAFALDGLKEKTGKKPQLGNLSEPGPAHFTVRHANRYSTAVDFSVIHKLYGTISAVQCIKIGGGTKIVIAQQAGNSAKSVKIQPKPEPGLGSTLPVVTVPKINKVKLKGRPLPDLNLTQASPSRNSTYVRKFNNEIYAKHLWLCGCEQKNAVFCFPCLLFGGDAAWTRSGVTDLGHLPLKIKKHESSQSHLKNVVSLAMLGKTNIAAQLSEVYRTNILKHNEEVRKNREILSNIIDCIKFCGQYELPLRGYDEENDSKNLGVFRGLLQFANNLNEPLKNHLEHASVFKEQLRQVLNGNNEKLIAQAYDGAAVMGGGKNGVQAIVKENYPNSHFVHCYAHQLNLILQQAASQNSQVRIFFSDLSGISAFLSRSSQRTAVFDKICSQKFPQASTTRIRSDESCDEEHTSAKRRKTDAKTMATAAKEICDKICVQARERFYFTAHPAAAKLLQTNQLVVLYDRREFHEESGVLNLYQILENSLSEVFSLFKIVLTTPMTTAEAERCFSTLKRIKIFLRSTMSEECLSALAMLTIERKLVEMTKDFNEKVMEEFIKRKNRRMDFTYKK
ncbi:hypothetical protein ANN_11326 [Periplaneta americana]|uniref:HAT C-terminal dimerisation domain-containing protein n=1 Tax=Periplaneta americana TaxID=6978 RepID=A0ABQ8T5V0_PERAM|nr:hypothetical protein ANN_11326 [Periplaneta americana]